MAIGVAGRVLMLLENFTYPQDGRVRREATTLVNAGYEVTVICPKGKAQPYKEIVAGVHVFRYPAPRPGNGLLGYAWEYGYSLIATFLLSIRALLGRGFDIIHMHNPPEFPILVAAPYKLLGKKIVFDHHDLSPDLYYHARFDNQGNPFVHRVLLFFERLTCQLADIVIATNESYKKVEIERAGTPENRISIVRNGPDLSRVREIDPDPNVRERANVILGYIGDIGFHDGVDYLMRALHKLVTQLQRTDFLCVVIGKGDAWQASKDLAAELGIANYVWFTGYVPSDTQAMQYLSAAHICVDPDPSNPFTDRSTMNKMMEYMALARPIVAFDLPEHRVTAGEAALYARDNDVLEFARHITTLMDDPQLRHEMGRLGRERIENTLAWSHQSVKLLDAYATLAPKRE